ncbi:hypothetical protein FY534_03485 [Alicyclobacillus sp. TC]|uniref:hypothetical protein n=1 Tax=Alicyclobacillus sp. TC TaxID=2606450 RepID=UPI00193206EB|nr:hypothetical protein [Alicyclobacillus sp. TC]QRF22844.1 hypothetical protein FY534_03485 [Alicyclobacillus sp. TC]
MQNQTQTTSSMNMANAQSLAPGTLAVKDVQYLQDEISWLTNAAKKCMHNISSCQDTEVQSLLRQMAQTHIRHAQLLAGHCTNATQKMSSSQH